ncbi:MAG: T9SS type A sorting domain-containing protein, partial [bacterium]|nr:T9SS type A sorting domain-containing protein [bacterium]
FTGSLLGAFTDLTMSIDNTNRTLTIDAVQLPGDANIPAASSGLMANLIFSIDALAADGAYEISPFLVATAGLNPIFVRDCGLGAEEVQPFVHLNGGSVLIAQSPTAVCGTVVDENWNEIVGATVELWDDLPAGLVEMMATTNSFGSFTFDNINSVPFDLYAFAGGYYPNSLMDVNFGETGLVIQLMPHQAVTPTNEMVFFYCGGEGALTTYMGGPVPVGSIIDAYDEDGVRCGTQVVTTAGKYLAMPVYRDDPFTQEDEGADPGDVIRFYINNIEAIPYGDHIWTQDRDQFLVCLEVSDQATQSCLLSEGWNLVSWRVDTPTDAIENVLSSLGSCVDFVIGFEQGGLAYDPDLVEFSTLHNVDHLSGYWIKVRQGCGDITLDVTGIGVPVSTPIPVTPGWNLVSYLPESSLPTADALASIHSDLVVAIGYDGGGTIYEPGVPGNSLTDMNSCLGYWVKVNQGGNLVYPGGAPLPASATKGATSPMAASDAGKPDVVQSTQWINIYSHNLTLNGEKLGAGTVITAHTEDGAKVGHFTIGSKETFGFMSVYGDDPMTDAADGVAFGETFYLAVNDQPTDQRFSWTGNGEQMEITGGLTAKSDPEALPTSYSLKQNYPNPFNPETTIGFSLAKAGKAKVEVYNILGELVATPFDGAANAGQNQVVWDGTNRDGKSVSSGIYFYRLTADNYSETRKMTLLK